MSNSIETTIDIDFLGGIDIGIDIDFWDFEKLTLVWTLPFLGSMSMGNKNPFSLQV